MKTDLFLFVPNISCLSIFFQICKDLFNMKNMGLTLTVPLFPNGIHCHLLISSNFKWSQKLTLQSILEPKVLIQIIGTQWQDFKYSDLIQIIIKQMGLLTSAHTPIQRGPKMFILDIYICTLKYMKYVYVLT